MCDSFESFHFPNCESLTLVNLRCTATALPILCFHRAGCVTILMVIRHLHMFQLHYLVMSLTPGPFLKVSIIWGVSKCLLKFKFLIA